MSAAALLGLVGWILQVTSGPDSDLRVPTTSRLSPPVALAAEHSFLHEHAGVTAYARVEWEGGFPDWGDLQKRLVGVQKSGPGFLVGVLDGREGDGADDNPHVLLHEDGWIAAYFPANQPAARMICHDQFPRGSRYSGSFGCRSQHYDGQHALQWALDEILRSTNAGILETGFFHFGYPDATMLLAATRTDGDPMSVYIPSDVDLRSVSISLDWRDAALVVLVDGTEVVKVAPQSSSEDRNTVVLDLPTDLFGPDVYHTIVVGFVERRDDFQFVDGYSVVVVARE